MSYAIDSRALDSRASEIHALDLPAGAPAPDLGRVQHARRRTLFLIALPALAVFPFIRSIWDWQGPMQEVVEDVGFALVLVAVLGRCWCSLYIGGRKMKKLVVRGPFSMVRNPLYFFSFIGAFGMGACSGSVVLATAFFAVTFLVFRGVVRKEEAALLAAFGAPYAAYCGRVPRFLPEPRLWHDEGTLEIHPGRVARTLIDALPFILAMPMFELIGALQLDGTLPVLLLLP
ncbi:isoprenylcysteine carboxylmethyltransferase family protein [Ancylobacter sp. MQZ15Z-1]|uniref:Isoprenylcysteine carboxylmethyltransferase family protein n=1 Tax=Ancylobacter mangrovi TaxID=2972472 RepID=A0A9X2T552_9HYPH|nr:isoprenylcysteine carboxylmethyltransferase family protein [Ancylobacter mangrovi]MCS0493598.1 isoprenylcysteine carboxylmethyltransferase family protein [Ancylobacter mangrovi]